MAVDFSSGYGVAAALATNTLTVVANIKTPATLSGFHVIVSLDDSRANNPCFFLNGDKVTLGDELGSDISGSTALSTSTWYNLAWIRNGLTDSKAYLNGALEVNITNQATAAGCTGTFVGAYSVTLPANFNGLIGYVKIWTAALTVAEVQQEHLSIVPSRLTNLWAWYPLSGDSSNRVVDFSGNARSLTETGTVVSATEESNVAWGGSPLIYPYAVGTPPATNKARSGMLLFF